MQTIAKEVTSKLDKQDTDIQKKLNDAVPKDIGKGQSS